MMIRSNGRYFDFDGEIEMERRVKLFEEIDETLGDFSYRLEIPNTGNNFSMLDFPVPDSVKSIYNTVNADVTDEDGIVLYTGQIRMEGYNDFVIYCSFFSGNYNWISLLSGSLSSIDFSDLDTDLSESEIINNGVNTDGIFFPIIDTGGLITRSSPNLTLHDFTGMIFVKTVFKKIFNSVGVKVTGDLMNDPVFNTLLLSRINIDPDAINNRSSFVGKGSEQTFSGAGISTTKITFTDETTVPFFDGSQNNFSGSTYTADIKMDTKVEAFFRFRETTPYNPANDQIIRFKIYINGVEVFSKSMAIVDFFQTVSINYEANLSTNDYIETFAYIETVDNITTVITADSWIKITPTFLYRVFGNSLVPKWTCAQFVNNVFSIFCAICDYEPVSKTLTIDLFNNIKTKSPVDISEFININDVDTSEFIADFGKKSTLKYADSDIDAAKEYNIKYFEPYGSGVIPVNNDFIPDTSPLLDSDFKAPVSYINPAFAASIDRVNFVEMEEVDSTDFTSMQDASGLTQVNMPDASIFRPLEICRIENCNVAEYNGDWFVTSTVSSTFIVIDRQFSGTATGRIIRLRHRITNSDDVHLFIAVTYNEENVSRFSNNEEYKIVENSYSNVSYAFFNLLNIGVEINSDYTQSLAFGVINNQLSYQRTLIETYWPQVERVLNDPLKLLCDGNIPKKEFFNLTPLRPIRIRTIKTNNLYYQNLISGYSSSYRTCQVELIKLS